MGNYVYWREAIASVSLSHPGSCSCKICRAAQGDEQAMREVIAELAEQEDTK